MVLTNNVAVLANNNFSISPKLLIDILNNHDAYYEVSIFIIDLEEKEIKNRLGNNGMVDHSTLKKQLKYSDADSVCNAISLSRQSYSSLYIEHNRNIASKLLSSDSIVYISHYSPLIIACLSGESIFNLLGQPYISYVDYSLSQKKACSTNNAYSSDQSLEICNINIARDTFGVSGNNVKVGIVDMGVPSFSELFVSRINYSSSNMYGRISYCF